MEESHLQKEPLDRTYASQQPWCSGYRRTGGFVVFSVTTVAGGVIILLAVFEVIGRTGSVGYCVAMGAGGVDILSSLSMIITLACVGCRKPAQNGVEGDPHPDSSTPRFVESKKRPKISEETCHNINTWVAALKAAGQSGDVPGIDFDVYDRDLKRKTALYRAAEIGNSAAIDYLINIRKVDPAKCQRSGFPSTPLEAFCAANHEDVSPLDLLLEGLDRKDIMGTYGIGISPFLMAVRCGAVKTVQKLFEKIKAFTKEEKEIYIHEAAAVELNPNYPGMNAENKKQIIAFLLRKGCNINCCIGQQRDTPLHKAVERRDLSTVQYLVGCGAKLIQDKYKHTPLDEARSSLDDAEKWRAQDDGKIKVLKQIIEELEKASLA